MDKEERLECVRDLIFDYLVDYDFVDIYIIEDVPTLVLKEEVEDGVKTIEIGFDGSIFTVRWYVSNEVEGLIESSTCDRLFVDDELLVTYVVEEL